MGNKASMNNSTTSLDMKKSKKKKKLLLSRKPSFVNKKSVTDVVADVMGKPVPSKYIGKVN